MKRIFVVGGVGSNDIDLLKTRFGGEEIEVVLIENRTELKLKLEEEGSEPPVLIVGDIDDPFRNDPTYLITQSPLFTEPRFHDLYYFDKKRKGHERPYKFHR